MYLRPIHRQRSVVRVIHACQDLGQRRLPGSIFTGKCNYFAGSKFQIDAVESLHRPKPFRDSRRHHEW